MTHIAHAGAARLTISRTNKLIVPALRDLEATLRLDRDLAPPHAMQMVTKPLVAGLRVFGLDVVRRDGLELLEHMLKRGLVAGGVDMADYLEGEIVDHIFRNTTIFASPTGVFVALYTADPGETGSDASEVSETGTAYARESVLAAGWSGAAGSSATDNGADVDFGTATGAGFGLLSHVAITDSTTRATGNHYLNGALSGTKQVDAGDSFKFAIGDLDVLFD